MELLPPDLEIRVTVETKGSETFLTYLLHSSSDRQGGFHYHTIRGRPIKAQPQDYQTALLHEIERLHDGKHADGSLALEEEIPIDLAALGRKLYRELFPLEMRSAYRGFRETVTTLLITSDEPWIPWELIKPYDDEADEVIDDDFLCVRFQLTRWLSGSLRPAPMIGVERLVCVEAGQGLEENHLPNAGKELQWLQRLARRHPGVDDRSLQHATYPRLKARLEEGGIDLLHFVGHGCFEAGDPDQSRFYLADGRSWRPLDLYGKVQTRTKGRRPLVFLNACQVGRQSFSLTGLGGWAPRWVRNCGAGAFVAPLWPVNDGLAHAFAAAFYGALEAGKTFGWAAKAARREVRRLDPSKPTWLAFTVYAHPNGRLILGHRPKPLTAEIRPRTDEESADIDLSIEADSIDTSGVDRARAPTRPSSAESTIDVFQRMAAPRPRHLMAVLLAVLAISWTPRLYEPDLGSMVARPASKNGLHAPATEHGGDEKLRGVGRQVEEPPMIPIDGSDGLVKIRIEAGPAMPLSQDTLDRELARAVAARIRGRLELDRGAPCLVILKFETASVSKLKEMTSCELEVGYRLLVGGVLLEEVHFYEIKSGFNQRTACVAAARTIGERAGDRILEKY